MYTFPNTESQTVEFKEVTRDSLPRDIWEVITAFANADGGTIYLGIDKLCVVKGVLLEHQDKLIQDVNSLCSSGFNHRVYHEISVAKGNVIRVFIPPVAATMRPLYSASRSLPKGGKVRIGTTNIDIDDEWLRRFGRAAQGGAELSVFPGNYEEYFTDYDVNSYLEAVKEKRGDVYKNLSRQIILQKLRAITSDNHMTLFGLLAFSSQYGLQELTAPSVNIAVTHYAGTSKVTPGNISQVSLDDKEFNGSVPNQFESALKLIMSKLPIRSTIEAGGKRQSYLAIPELAIRETLANALGHRDYSTFRMYEPRGYLCGVKNRRGIA